MQTMKKTTANKLTVGQQVTFECEGCEVVTAVVEINGDRVTCRDSLGNVDVLDRSCVSPF
jgi:hypothetical protein